MFWGGGSPKNRHTHTHTFTLKRGRVLPSLRFTRRTFPPRRHPGTVAALAVVLWAALIGDQRLGRKRRCRASQKGGMELGWFQKKVFPLRGGFLQLWAI